MSKREFDLEERTGQFGKKIILFAKKTPRTVITTSLISQLVRAGTSVGANHREADNAESKKDFIHKLSIAKKEAKETGHWLKMIMLSAPALKKEGADLYQESKELVLIFSAIINRRKQFTY